MSASGIGYRILANFASDALYFGLIEPAKIIAWADELIAASDVPTLWMIEVSLADLTDPMALYAALGAVPGTPDKSESVNLLSALVLREWRRGALTIGRVRGVGWELYREEFERREASRWGVVVECAGEDLDNGYISEADMCHVIDRALHPFIPHIQRLPPWV